MYAPQKRQKVSSACARCHQRKLGVCHAQEQSARSFTWWLNISSPTFTSVIPPDRVIFVTAQACHVSLGVDLMLPVHLFWGFDVAYPSKIPTQEEEPVILPESSIMDVSTRVSARLFLSSWGW
jgi:hypothetical protein